MKSWLFLLILLKSMPIVGEPQRQHSRVSGYYFVKSIAELPGGGKQIVFTSTGDGDQTKTLILESDHVHLSLIEGLTLELSAEVLSQRRVGVWEVSQVLLYFDEGRRRVFQISRNRKFQGLTGARLLDMHSPANDYIIF